MTGSQSRRNSMRSKRNSQKRIKCALIVLCLLASLTSCATTEPDKIVSDHYIKVPIPLSLLPDCSDPQLKADKPTYQDGFDLAKARAQALKACNDEIAEARKWGREKPQ